MQITGCVGKVQSNFQGNVNAIYVTSYMDSTNTLINAQERVSFGCRRQTGLLDDSI